MGRKVAEFEIGIGRAAHEHCLNKVQLLSDSLHLLIAKLIRSLAKQEDAIDAFDERMFLAVVGNVTVNRDGISTLHLINGTIL